MSLQLGGMGSVWAEPALAEWAAEPKHWGTAGLCSPGHGVTRWLCPELCQPGDEAAPGWSMAGSIAKPLPASPGSSLNTWITGRTYLPLSPQQELGQRDIPAAGESVSKASRSRAGSYLLSHV